MLNLLRRIAFPAELQASGPVIKARMLNYIRTHDDLIEHANQEAARIIREAQAEAAEIKAAAREEEARAVRGDLHAMRKLTEQKEQQLQQKSSAICTEVCVVVLEQFVAAASDYVKIKTLAEALVVRSHSARELNLRANPGQIELVTTILGEVLAEQMNLRKWNVKPDEDLKEFELKICTTNGAEISVSMDNLIAMYKEEIERLEPSLVPALQNFEVGNESIS